MADRTKQIQHYRLWLALSTLIHAVLQTRRRRLRVVAPQIARRQAAGGRTVPARLEFFDREFKLDSPAWRGALRRRISPISSSKLSLCRMLVSMRFSTACASMPSNCWRGFARIQSIALVDHEHRLGERRQDRFNLRLPRRIALDAPLPVPNGRVPLVPPASHWARKTSVNWCAATVHGLVGSKAGNSDASVPCANCNASTCRALQSSR